MSLPMRILRLLFILIVSSCGAPNNPKPKSRAVGNMENLEGVPKGDYYRINRSNEGLKRIKLKNGGLLLYRLNSSKNKLYLNLSKFKDDRTTNVYEGLGKFIQGDLENIGYNTNEFGFNPIESSRENRYFIDVKYSNNSLLKHILELDHQGRILKKHTLIHPLKTYSWKQVKLKVMTSENYLEVVSPMNQQDHLQLNIYDINFKYLYSKNFKSGFLKNCASCNVKFNHQSKDPENEFLIFNEARSSLNFSLFRFKVRNDRVDVARLFEIEHRKPQEYSSVISLSKGRLKVNFSDRDEKKSFYSLNTPLRGNSENLAKFKIERKELDLNNQCVVVHGEKIYQLYSDGKVRVLDLNLDFIEEKKIRFQLSYLSHLVDLKRVHPYASFEFKRCKLLKDGIGAELFMKTSTRDEKGYTTKFKRVGYLSVSDLL